LLFFTAQYLSERTSFRSRNEFGTGCHASLKCRHENGTV